MHTMRSSVRVCQHSASQLTCGATSATSRASNFRSATRTLHAPRLTQYPKSLTLISPRYNSTVAPVLRNPDRPSDAIPKSLGEMEPAYEVTFTCKPCKNRSKHRMSKQGYHKGTVLITCPKCKNRHVMSDHLRIFSDTSVTIEDIMRKNGQLVRRGHVATKGDFEFWDDGSTVQTKGPDAEQEEVS